MDAANIAVRLVQYLALGALFGLAVFPVYAPRSVGGVAGRRIFLILIAVAALATLASLVVLAGQMSGSLAGAGDPSTWWAVIASTGVGKAWLVRLLGLGAAILSVIRGSKAPQNLPLASGVALATLAWGGHAAAESGLFGQLRLIGDILHLLAAGVWVGALVAFVILIFRREAAAGTAQALARFSGVGTAVVATLVVTGLLNTWHSVAWTPLPQLTDSPWGDLLIIKLSLFIAMLALAAANRFVLTPRLLAQTRADEASGHGYLRLSLIVELGFALAILAVVSWLGTLSPPLSI